MANEKVTKELEAFASLVGMLKAPMQPPSDLDGAPPFVVPGIGKVTAWRSIMGGRQARVLFPNGYEASVVRHRGSYGSEDGLWELAVCAGEDGPLVYDTPITSDVIGRMTEAAVTDTLHLIAALPARSAPSPRCTCGSVATERAGKGGGQGTDLCARCWRDEFSDPAGADYGE